MLNVTHNRISKILKNCFQVMTVVTSLYVSNNNIWFTESQFFLSLLALRYLDLSNNPILVLPSSLLNNMSLKLLKLYTQSFVKIDKKFSSIDVQLIDTNNHHICCSVELVSVCFSARPWFMKCFSPLLNRVIFTCCVVVCLLAFVLNLGSFACHIAQRASHKAFSCSVTVSNASNCLYVFYRSVMCVTHYVHGNTFYLEEHFWRSHPMCYTAFTAILLFVVLDLSLLCRNVWL